MCVPRLKTGVNSRPAVNSRRSIHSLADLESSNFSNTFSGFVTSNRVAKWTIPWGLSAPRLTADNAPATVVVSGCQSGNLSSPALGEVSRRSVCRVGRQRSPQFRGLRFGRVERASLAEFAEEAEQVAGLILFEQAVDEARRHERRGILPRDDLWRGSGNVLAVGRAQDQIVGRLTTTRPVMTLPSAVSICTA